MAETCKWIGSSGKEYTGSYELIKGGMMKVWYGLSSKTVQTSLDHKSLARIVLSELVNEPEGY
ncbi:MAG: hypothetical protein ABII07_02295 [Patescibacteria group bacterium]